MMWVPRLRLTWIEGRAESLLCKPRVSVGLQVLVPGRDQSTRYLPGNIHNSGARVPSKNEQS